MSHVLRVAVRRTAGALPSVKRWTPPYWFLGAFALLVLQLMSDTGLLYAFLVFSLMLMSYAAIRSVGGLDTLFGLCIFYLLVQHVLVAQIAKIFYWQPADAPLRQPIATMSVYVIGMASLAVGGWLAGRFAPFQTKPLFPPETKLQRVLWLSILSTFFYILMALVSHTTGSVAETGASEQGGAVGPLKQINYLGQLAVTSATWYLIKSSQGRHSFGFLNALPMFVMALLAVLSAAREASVTPFFLYVLCCFAFGYRFRFKHFAFAVIIAYLANFIIFPYALIARGITRNIPFAETVSRSADLLSDVISNPLKYHDQITQMGARKKLTFNYFDFSSPILERYSVLVTVDAVVDATLRRGTTGMDSITPMVIMLAPRFIVPDKPFFEAGNFLAHREPGLMHNKYDLTTGITLGFFADAFSSFEWAGISLIPAMLIFSFLIIYRFLIKQSLWNNVWMLALVVQGATNFSEGTIGIQILTCFQYSLAILIGFFVLHTLVDAIDYITNRMQPVLTHRLPRKRGAVRTTLSTAIRSAPLSAFPSPAQRIDKTDERNHGRDQ